MNKPSGAYWLVQDLCLINEAVIPVHPLVNNPYILLSNIPPTTSYFTVLDLKDAFFTVPLHPDSYFLFVPDSLSFRQLTWTVLPQGLWDSHHFFGQALSLEISQTAAELTQKVLKITLSMPIMVYSTHWSCKTIPHQLRIMDNTKGYLFEGKNLQITVPNNSALITNRKQRV